MAQIGNSRSRLVSKVGARPKRQEKSSPARPARGKRSLPSAQILRREPTQDRARLTRDAVITAAEQLLITHGYARTSTNLIAKRAGVSVGSLYQYFNDKEAVFRAVVQHHREQVMPPIQRAFEAMQDGQREFVAVVLDLMREMSRVNARNADLMVAIDHELNWLEHETDGELDLGHGVRQTLRSRYAVPERELTVIAELLVLTVSQLSRWLVHGKPQHINAEAFIVATGRMLQALLPEPASPRPQAATKGSLRH